MAQSEKHLSETAWMTFNEKLDEIASHLASLRAMEAQGRGGARPVRKLCDHLDAIEKAAVDASAAAEWDLENDL